MSNGSDSASQSRGFVADQPHLNANVIGACLRSAFIEALYDDCTDLMPQPARAPEPKAMAVAAE